MFKRRLSASIIEEADQGIHKHQEPLKNLNLEEDIKQNEISKRTYYRAKMLMTKRF